MAPSSSGLGRRPLKAEVAGSNPVGATRYCKAGESRPFFVAGSGTPARGPGGRAFAARRGVGSRDAGAPAGAPAPEMRAGFVWVLECDSYYGTRSNLCARVSLLNFIPS